MTNCTGRYSPLSQNLWRAGQGFRDNLDLLLTQKGVQLVVDEHINFLRYLTTLFFCGSVGLRLVTSYDAISDSGLWGLLYYTGYLTIESVLDRSMVCVRTIFFIHAHVSIVSIYFSNTKWGGRCAMARMGDEMYIALYIPNPLNRGFQSPPIFCMHSSWKTWFPLSHGNHPPGFHCHAHFIC